MAARLQMAACLCPCRPLVCRAMRYLWLCQVHFRSYPREVLLAWEEEEETVKWAFVNNLKEVGDGTQSIG